MNLSLVLKRLLKKGFRLPTFPRECILSNSIITDSHCLFTFLLSLCSLLTVCLRTPFSSSFSWSSYFFFLTFSVTNSETWEFLRVRDERETESCERETEIREWDLWVVTQRKTMPGKWSMYRISAGNSYRTETKK